MEFELKGALKKYNRMRSWRSYMTSSMMLLGLVVPWFFGFNQTDTMVFFVGALVVWGVQVIELRLKTIQVRLAGMNDQLSRLSGNQDADDLILELNDW